MSDNDDYALSESTRRALQEFLDEQALANLASHHSIEENWQLSQFWYNEETSKRLALECLSVVEMNDSGLIGCLCCPSVYDKMIELDSARASRARLFEFDRRFATQGRQFVFYDYQCPTDLPAAYKASCAVVIADPPFLSEECLLKVITTVKFLTNERIICCTGVSMERILTSRLKLKRCRFVPQHSRKLANEFRCYANYPTVYLDDEKEE